MKAALCIATFYARHLPNATRSSEGAVLQFS